MLFGKNDDAELQDELADLRAQIKAKEDELELALRERRGLLEELAEQDRQIKEMKQQLINATPHVKGQT